MKYRKNILCMILRTIIIVCFAAISLYSPIQVQADDEFAASELYALSAVLIDADTGRILFEKDGYTARANASTTKILTCILALEYGNLDDMVTVSSYAAKMPDVQLNMREGEEYRLGDLLYSLMLESHNDTAVAIAEHIGGSVEGFADMMNAKAKEIGCTNTYFITPNGLDASDENGTHSTTATDLAKILRYCIKISPEKDTFLEITRTESYSFSDSSGARSYTCINRNAFLKMMEGALTGKTGFTGNAGYCYVGALERNGHTYIVALLGCGWPNNKNYKWSDTKKLMNYGIENYNDAILCDNDLKPMQTIVTDGVNQKEQNLPLYCKYTYRLIMREGETISYVYNFPNSLPAPVYQDSVVGSVSIYINDELYKIEPVYIEESVEKETLSYELRGVIKKYFSFNP